MPQKAPLEVKEAFFEVVENQIRDGNPPIVAATLERLIQFGILREEAVRLIACALTVEIYEVMTHKTTFNGKRYETNLAKLPTLPWE